MCIALNLELWPNFRGSSSDFYVKSVNGDAIV